jgi:pyrroline-5-carboxylate reductase
MGGAMLSRWREKFSDNGFEFFVVSPTHSASETFFPSLAEFPKNISPDIIVFAVKPQNLAEILPEYKNRFGVSPLYISIAAGKPISFFAEHLGEGAKIIRTMPNTPALVGKAITAICASANVSDAEKQTAQKLMEAIGSAVFVDEKDMDAVTAVSGSGPAYVFLFLEALATAGERAGLSGEVAKKLALASFHGSIHLAEKSGESFEKLRENVTSKGGTTEAALNVLMQENGLKNLLENAVSEAVKKAKILAKQ